MKENEMVFGIRAVIEAIQADKEIDKILVKRELQGDLSRELFEVLKGFGDRRFSLFVTFGPCRLYRRKRGEPMKFQRIQDLRTDADLSQKQISDILHISQRSYSHYETGSRNIPIEMLIRLANYYETSIDYLVGRTDNKKMP